jgi:hypothetical protein
MVYPPPRNINQCRPWADWFPPRNKTEKQTGKL